MQSQEAGVEFRHIAKRYSVKAPAVIEGLSFVIPKGQLTTLLGPSGCGKTTTLRMIAGLETPSAGQVLINGEDVTHLPPSQRNVSLVFQSYALFPHMDVLANVCYGLECGGMPTGQARIKAQAALDGVGLLGYEQRLPSELSGGQQQRVALARALVIEPAVLLFDEPLSNLDARLRRSMREEIRSLQQRLGLTVAYVTHDQAEAVAVSDQIIVMQAGRIAQMGSAQAVYERPANAFVASFMGEALLLDAQAAGFGRVQAGPLQCAPSGSVVPGAMKLAVRPEAWQLDGPGSAGPSALPATLAKRSYLGQCVELSFETELGSVLVVSRDTQRQWAIGEACWLRLPDGAATVMSA